MKKIIFFLLFSFCLHSQAQFVTIPDPNFRAFLVANYPSCFNASQQMDTTCSGIVNEDSLFSPINWGVSSIDGVQYFDNLISLDCSYLYLSSLPSLPNTLLLLSCEQNFITTLPTLPPNLKVLGCSNNNLNFLPTLPNTITSLYCNKNNLTSLPSLPDSLIHFECHDNMLTKLPLLPNKIGVLGCSKNKITNLPSLPDSLVLLICDNNLLFGLPTLNSKLAFLYCGDNLLTSLPSFPSSLLELKTPNNLLLSCLPILPYNFNTLDVTQTSINCIPNFLPIYLTPPLPICTGGSSCETQPTISGMIFYDINSNNIFEDLIDIPIQNWIVSNSNGWVASSSPNGEYQMKLDSGVVNTFSLSPLNIYSTINPTSYTITPTSGGSQGNNYDFAVRLIPNIQDLRVDIANGPARPGFNQWVNLMANNVGTLNMSNATVKVLKPSTFTFVNATPAISTQIGDTLIWNNVNLNVFQQTGFDIHWSIPSSAVIGTPYQIESWILPSVGDTTPSNNYAIFNGVLQGSYDPNDKTVSKTIISPATLDEELKYTIRFQNTGTDTAFNIVVRDELSSNLDISKFKMLGASTNYSFLIREKGLLEVFFQNIQLPDSNINEPASHGFFEYSIKPKATMTANDSILNTANIYFDFNSPIITNTVVTKMIVTGINELSTIEAKIFPNPTDGKLNIELYETKATFTLTDINGRILIEKNIHQKDEINVSHLPAGVYIGKIKTNNGIKVVKIVKED